MHRDKPAAQLERLRNTQHSIPIRPEECKLTGSNCHEYSYEGRGHRARLSLLIWHAVFIDSLNMISKRYKHAGRDSEPAFGKTTRMLYAIYDVQHSEPLCALNTRATCVHVQS